MRGTDLSRARRCWGTVLCIQQRSLCACPERGGRRREEEAQRLGRWGSEGLGKRVSGLLDTLETIPWAPCPQAVEGAGWPVDSAHKRRTLGPDQSQVYPKSGLPKVRFTLSLYLPSPTMHIKAPLCMVPEVLVGSSSQGAPCPCSGVLAHQLSAVVLQKRPAPAPAPQLYAFVHSGGSCLSQFIFF